MTTPCPPWTCADRRRKSAPPCGKAWTSTTVILISHRITTLMQADRILVLDGGRVGRLGLPPGADLPARHSTKIFMTFRMRRGRAMTRPAADGRRRGLMACIRRTGDITKSFDLSKSGKRLTPLLAPYRDGFCGACLHSTPCAPWCDVVLPLFQRLCHWTISLRQERCQGLVPYGLCYLGSHSASRHCLWWLSAGTPCTLK